MARALSAGFIRAGKATAEEIIGSDVSADARRLFEAQTGAAARESNRAVAQGTRVLILAVKPQIMDAVLAELKTALTDEHLVISIAAGVPLARLAAALGSDRRLIRVMPNTPCLVGAAASAIAAGGAASDEHARFVEDLFRSVGIAVRVPESLLDAVTGLSGSGPAYVFQFIEAMSDGGVRAGLSRDVAMQLAAQTVLGAAKMVLETGRHPADLKDAVASPAGTTIAGLAVLERAGMRGAIIDAVYAAAERAKQLGRDQSPSD
jgi:pyrroline-5-carboxylate reductase